MADHSFTIVDKFLLGFSKRLCRAIAKEFGLYYKSVNVMHHTDDAWPNSWGYCCDKYIVIKFKKGDKYLPVEEIVDTLTHEMAHLSDPEEEDGARITYKEMHNSEWKKRHRNYLKFARKHIRKRDLCLPGMIL